MMDISKMDISKIKIDLREQKELIFIIIVVVVTGFLGKKILDSQRIKVSGAQEKINYYQQRMELAADINSLNKEIGKFKDAGWQSQETAAIMSAVNELASKYDVEILTFDPGGLRDEQHYLSLAMVLNIRGDYFSLAKFISAIENLNALTKIASLQITPTGEQGSEEYGPIVQANLNIVAFILKK
jgi:Tfp pilus assembly protein PilO